MNFINLIKDNKTSKNRKERRREQASLRRLGYSGSIPETAAKAITSEAAKEKRFKSIQNKFADLSGPAIVTSSIVTWMNDFFRTGPLSDLRATGIYSGDLSYDGLTDFAIKSLTAPVTFAKVSKMDKGSVLVKMSTPVLPLGFRIAELGQDTSPEEKVKIVKQNLDKIEEQFRVFFPTFKMPVNYQIKTREESSGGLGFNSRRVSFNIVEQTSPILKISHIRGVAGAIGKKFKGEYQQDIVENFPEFSPQMENYSNDIEVQLSLEADPELLGYYSSQLTKIEEMGEIGTIESLLNISSSIRAMFKVSVNVFLRYPLDYALWVTCNQNVDDFDPVEFTDLHNMRINKSLYKRQSAANPPARIASMSKVAGTIDVAEKTYNYKFKPRTNEQHFCTTRTGSILWAPPVNNTKDFENLSKRRFNPQTGEIVPAQNIQGMPNKLVLTDWKAGKLTYTTNSGKLSFIDLSGAMPLSDVTINNMLNLEFAKARDDGEEENAAAVWIIHSTIYSYFDRIIDQVELKEIFDESVEQVKLVRDEKDANLGIYMPQSFAGTLNGLAHAYPSITLNQIMNPEKRWDDLKTVSPSYLCKVFMLQKGFERCYQKLRVAKLPAGVNLSLYDRIHTVQFGVYCGAVFAKKSEYFAEQYSKSQDRNNFTDVETDEYVPSAPNMPGLEYLLPHQKDWIAKVDMKEPINLFASVSVGGGKTVTGILDLVLLLKKKKVKRGLIVMPEKLLSQYANEILTFSKGKLNPFIINTTTMETFMSNIEFDDRKLVKMVVNAPPNTIFLTSYEWLKSGDTKGLIKPLDDTNTNVLINGNEMIYGPFSMGSKSSKGSFYPSVKIFPMVEILQRCEFDFIGLDESHWSKNTQGADVGIATANLMATAKIKRFLSGTIITDRPVDLVGPMSMVAPEVFHSPESFTGRFMTNGQLQPDKVTEISKLMKDHVASVTKTQSDWAFIMPDIVQTRISAVMSPHQAMFYDILMAQAKADFAKEIDVLVGGKPSDGDIEKFFEDLDNEDNIDEKSGPEEDEGLQKRIEAAAIRALHRVEVFMSAPDEDAPKVRNEDEGVVETEAYKNYIFNGRKPSADDLISPKAKIVYEICRAHLFGKKTSFGDIEKDESQYNKIFVVGYNPAVSRHILRHMPNDLRAQTIRFAATKSPGDDDPNLKLGADGINTFLNDTRIKILVADESSMAEGHNLQIASRLIRVQTVWSPGRQEQVNGRVIRPDPKGKYDRSKIFVNLLSVAHPSGKITVDEVKVARMLSKIISKARIDNKDDPAWRKEMAFNQDIADLGIIRMNLSSIDAMEVDDLLRYEQADAVYKNWQASQFEKKRAALLAKIQRKFPDATMADLRKLALEKVQPLNDIEGTADYYTPLVYGQKVPDPHDLDLIPVVQADIFGDIDEDSEGFVLEKDQPVRTEFGYGYVMSVSKTRAGTPGNKVSVNVPGLGRVSVKRGAVLVPATERGKVRLENLMNQLGKNIRPFIDKEGNVTIPKPINIDLDKKTKPVKVEPLPPSKPKVKVEEEEEDIDDNFKNLPVDDDNELVMSALSIAGMPALMLHEEDTRVTDKFLKQFPKWQALAPFLAIPVKSSSYKGYMEIIEQLVDVFDVSPKRVAFLQEAGNTMKGHRGKLIFEGTNTTQEEMRNFFLESHRKIRQSSKKSAKIKISPWLLLWKDDVFICFDEYAHPPTMERLLRTKVTNRVTMAKPVRRIPEDDSGIKIMSFFNSKNSAMRMLDHIEKRGYEIIDVEEVIDELQEAKIIKKAKEEEEEKKTRKKTSKKPAAKTAKKPATRTAKKPAKTAKPEPRTRTAKPPAKSKKSKK